MKKLWIITAVLALLLSVQPGAQAEPPVSAATPRQQSQEGILNKLLAPGPLIEGHKKFETIDCLKCHTLRKGVPDSKCLACHDEIREEVLRKGGYHGLTTQTCIACHSDHKGRDFDSTLVNRKTFDHDETGFKLEGKHGTAKCEDCHTATRLEMKKYLRPHDPHYLGLKSSCVSCHKKDDVHFFDGKWAQKDCDSCHGVKSWKTEIRFNHEKVSGYKLDGKHFEIKCATCHVPKDKPVIYKWPDLKKDQCLACHENPHGKQFHKKFSDQNCAECHSTQSFTHLLPFNHDKTAYPLRGKHMSLKCEECHKPTAEKFPGTQHFKSQFIFSHPEQRFCVDCHKNVHQDQFHSSFSSQSCGQCHNEKDFHERLPFDHDQTAYKLRGKHMGLKCEQCHIATNEKFEGYPKIRKSKFLFPEMATQDCASCHQDPHRGGFGKRCSECHTDKDWKTGSDFHKNFTLTGVHTHLECYECHQEGRKLAGQSQQCALCHQKDDIHHGTLPNCASCHRQELWEDTLFKHSMTLFPLRGVHRTLDCNVCHLNNVYKGTPNQCVNCHLQEALAFPGPPNHSALLGTSCLECHNQFSFH